MIRHDLHILITNAATGLRATWLLLSWPVRKDRRAVVEALVARQHRMDTLALGPGEAATVPARVVPWLLCQALLGPGVLLLSALMWVIAGSLVLLALGGLFSGRISWSILTIQTQGGPFVAALSAPVMVVIAVACSHGLIRWHASVNRLLGGGLRRSRLTRRIAVLTESRAGVLEVQAAELRRIERDLHDGAQARLVSLSMLLGRLDLTLREGPADARQLLSDARGQAGEALRDLRDLVRGGYPPILADRGLSGGIESLAEHAGSNLNGIAVTVTVDVADRLPVALESTVYFVVAEALTNVTRHSGAGRAAVSVRSDGYRIRVEVTDDGRGGADEQLGTGLAGLRRRVAAFDGDLVLTSPAGGPTVLEVELPCAS